MKTWLVIKREYLTRVKKRMFLVTTLLLPILALGAFVLIGVLASSSSDSKKIAVVDEGGYFKNKISDSKNVSFGFVNLHRDSFNSFLGKEEYHAILHIPRFNIEEKVEASLFSAEQLGITVSSVIDEKFNAVVETDRMKAAGIDEQQLKNIQSKSLHVVSKVGKEEKVTSNEIAAGIGYACGMILYALMFVYGMSVMNSVMEEKTNRIAEIIISSVKPFQLMIGKIVGVALVGLTQFAIWLLFIVILLVILATTVGVSLLNNPEFAQQIAEQMAATGQAPTIPDNIIQTIGSTNWIAIIFWFMFYFLGGYFLYAALFAAVGSLVNEDPQESNNFTFPITLPIIVGFVIMMMAIKEPHSGLAIFGSLFPLTSPIVMMARIPFGVPGWQLLLSVLFLLGGFFGAVWLAGKIYRTGILLYGKKITLKEVGKWLVKG